MPSPGKGLRTLLTERGLSFIMEAHNGLSAKIVEETGFPGIWASGLSISSSLGVRDSNEASWTQVLEVVEFMADACSIPILLDGDTGYGNFNNARRLVRKLEQRGVAGVCIEDKLFPKTNSFIGECQPLADVEEFCGKIKAAKDAQADDDFVLVARVEALIAGWDMDEALRRAEAYRAAGADAILIHSKQSVPDQVLTFAKEWAGRLPLVIVPTKYYATPTRWFRDAGIDLIIWANHNVRAATRAMQATSRKIFEQQSLVEVEPEVAPVGELFRLVGNDELAAAEERYLNSAERRTEAIVLGASRGVQLQHLTDDRPKCMLAINGVSILERNRDTLRAAGIENVTCVAGYRADAVRVDGVAVVRNDDYERTGEASSLMAARDRLEGPAVISFGDILYRPFILDMLLREGGELVLAVDPSRTEGADLVRCSRPYVDRFETDGAPVRLDPEGPGSGRWIGLLAAAAKGSQTLTGELDRRMADGTLPSSSLLDCLVHVADVGADVRVVYVDGHWMDVNQADDFVDAGRFAGN